jgi:hypothetical protein
MRETVKGQQVAQLLDSYMMMMMTTTTTMMSNNWCVASENMLVGLT